MSSNNSNDHSAHQPRGPTAAEAQELIRLATLGARSAGASAGEVDDVAQNTSIKLLERWDTRSVARARETSSDAWRAYVFVVARRCFLDLRRSAGRSRKREQVVTLGHDGQPLHVRPSTTKKELDGPSDVERYLGRHLILGLIEESGATAKQRQVLCLHLIDGMTTAEIAERLGMQPRRVNAHKQAGLQRLQEVLRRSPEAEPDTETG